MLNGLSAVKHAVNRNISIPLAICAFMISQASSVSANAAEFPSISCFIVNEANGKPVTGIRVEVVSDRTGQVIARENTDAKGRCFFENLPKDHPVWVRVQTSRGHRWFGLWVKGVQVPFPNHAWARRNQTLRVTP